MSIGRGESTGIWDASRRSSKRARRKGHCPERKGSAQEGSVSQDLYDQVENWDKW